MTTQRNINMLRTPNPAGTGMSAFALRGNCAGAKAAMKRSQAAINRPFGYGYVSGHGSLPTRMFEAGAPSE